MRCNQCGTEFEGKFCPECGTKADTEPSITLPSIQQQQEFYQQPIPVATATSKKKKKPFFLRWWFILLAIIAVGSIALNKDNKTEKIVWDDMVLGDLLPEPPASKGEIHTNSANQLWIDICKISDKQFNDYINACKEKGFTVDADLESHALYAYNAEGYYLSLTHYEDGGDMGIRLEAPLEMTTISWPTGVAGEQLPIPKSTIGQIIFEYDDNFCVYVGNTSKDDYTEYVTACSEKGFNVDYSKGDDYYFADNSEGWSISVCYEGNNIMSISIDAPIEDVNNEVAIPSTDSLGQVSVPDMTETEAETDMTETEAEPDTPDNGGLDPDFKAAMDSYEAFMDEYVAFMKKYEENPSDLDLLVSYTDYLSKYADFVEDFEKWEDEEMNDAETAYYIEVQLRVSNKLLEVAYE